VLVRVLRRLRLLARSSIRLDSGGQKEHRAAGSARYHSAPSGAKRIPPYSQSARGARADRVGPIETKKPMKDRLFDEPFTGFDFNPAPEPGAQ
jgi:hypothetical protein